MKKTPKTVLQRKKMQLPPFFSFCFFLLPALFCPAPLLGQWIERGEASYYADKFHGRPTASGEKYNKNALTAAHRTLPMGSVVRVSRPNTGLSVEVRINDCGPHKRGRIIDLSKAAAKKLDLLRDGVADVHVELVQAGDGHCACDRNKKWTPAGRPEAEIALSPPNDPGIGPVENGNENSEPAPAEETPAAMPQQGIALQIGAFGNKTNAERMVQNAKAHAFENAFLKEFPPADATLYRVYAGIFPSREDALKAQGELKKKMGIAAVIVELTP